MVLCFLRVSDEEGLLRGNDTECYCVCCEFLVEREYREELILNVSVFVVIFWWRWSIDRN
jgi:hypothetical protein